MMAAVVSYPAVRALQAKPVAVTASRELVESSPASLRLVQPKAINAVRRMMAAVASYPVVPALQAKPVAVTLREPAESQPAFRRLVQLKAINAVRPMMAAVAFYLVVIAPLEKRAVENRQFAINVNVAPTQNERDPA